MELDVADHDGELVGRCLAGDAAGLRDFVERFQSSVFGLCFRMLGHREDAEDVAQDVLLRAWRGLPAWQTKHQYLKSWVLTIAVNRCRTALSSRRRKAWPSDFAADLVDRSVPPLSLEIAEELELALEQLRPEHRLCFILCHLNELTPAEISRIVEVPASTVKTWLFRSRRELAIILRRRGLAPPVNHELSGIQ
jgi:RNA polymerase sigma-70 factor (ECF subfamily)